MSGCFVYDFRIGHSHPFCIKYSFFLFLAYAQWDYMNIGAMVLSHTKAPRAESCFHQQQIPKQEWEEGKHFIFSPGTLIASTSVGSGNLIICM